MKKHLSNLNEAVPWLNIGVQRSLLLVSVVLLTPLWLMGQQQTVSGTITDDTGEPVPGANILKSNALLLRFQESQKFWKKIHTYRSIIL